MPSFQEILAANADDGHEVCTAEVQPGSWADNADADDLGHYGADKFNGGYRFIVSDAGVGPLTGATISAATLTTDLQINNASPGPNINIFADDVDNAAAWGVSSRPSEITQTTATTTWQPPAQTTGPQIVTVTSIVQEIVNRAGWTPGNAMRFALMATNGQGSRYVSIDAINDAAGAETLLDITYANPAADTGLPGPRPASRASLQQRL